MAPNLSPAQDLLNKIEELRRTIRAGDIEVPLIQEVWSLRSTLEPGTFGRLSIHSLTWEYFDNRGEFEEAARRLREGGGVKSAIDLLETLSATPEQFVISEFPDGLPDYEKRRRYELWRQRTVCALAWCFAAYRLKESGLEERFSKVEAFVEGCLGRAGFPCDGTRSRFYFFRAQFYQSKGRATDAAADYGLSLDHCIKRAHERLKAGTRQSHREAEQAFAMYCMGKLKLKLGQLDYDHGRLDSAKRYAREASLLLRVSRDPFLPEMAALLGLRIERHLSTFFRSGSAVPARLQEVRDHLLRHEPFSLEAWLELVIANVYLHKAEEPTAPKAPPPALSQALSELREIREKARVIRLAEVQLRASLAEARTLCRLGNYRSAHSILVEAHHIARNSPKGRAEVLFVEGKVHAAEANSARRAKHILVAEDSLRLALRKFREARGGGHPSLMFQMACGERIAELLLESGRIVEADAILNRLREDLPNLEGTFLRTRLEELLNQIDKTRYCVFNFGPGFDVEGAGTELERSYLLDLCRRMGVDLIELQSRWAEFKEKASPLDYDALRSLVRKHFPTQLSRGRKTAATLKKQK